MYDLASCWYNLLTKQRVCTGVKIKTTGDSKLNLFSHNISMQILVTGLLSTTWENLFTTISLTMSDVKALSFCDKTERYYG